MLSEQRWYTLGLAAVVIGAVLRIVWTFVLHSPVDFVYSDMKEYVTRAKRLASGVPLDAADAFFPPGTHVLLAVPLRLFGAGPGLWVAAALWCALSVAVVWLSWRLARELLTPAAAGMTAALCALWPLFITDAGFFTSETPAMAFLVAALWTGVLATRRCGRAAIILALLAGLLGGAAIVVRPQLLINMLIMAAVIAAASRRRIAPTTSFAAGLLAVSLLAVLHNSMASGQLTGLSRNGGLNFWFGHCEARQVITLNANGEQTGIWTQTVPNLAGRGDDFFFQDVNTWDDPFFYDLGWKCISADGARHLWRLARNVLDMTATTVPFPQADAAGWPRDIVQSTNIAYAVLLPWILIEAAALIARRRRLREPVLGVGLLLANLACAVLVAVLYFGDPRVRSVYDAFGLALLAALLADRFRFDRPAAASDLAEGRSEPGPA